jgi:Zn-finger nucleic acid-binding protein
MICPRCSDNLDERVRDGVAIDVCGRCRGIWLDRGELEKLIARTTAELDELERGRAPHDDDRRRPAEGDRRHHADDRDRYRDDRDRHHGHSYRRKKSWLESLGDIFD